MSYVAPGAPLFRHKSLNVNKQEMRLVSVLPRINSAPLSCRISHVDLNKNPEVKYAALSYTWGPYYPARRILLNGRSFGIRDNLYDFLHGVASAPKPQEYRLWIDQLCIDQEDSREKTHQVQQMRTIFSRASEVVVWLGRTSRDSAIAMDAIRHWPTSTRVIQRTLEEPLLALFDRPFWHRLWVVQEVVLARDVHVLCGDSFVDRADIQVFYDAEPLFGEDLKNFFHERPAAATLLQARPRSSAGQLRLPLLLALSKFHLHACEDLGDKVYGLMSIVVEEDQIPVDYNKSTSEVFIDAAERSIALNLWYASTKLDLQLCHDIIELGRSMGVFTHGLHQAAFLRRLAALEFFTEGIPRRSPPDAPLYLTPLIQRQYPSGSRRMSLGNRSNLDVQVISWSNQRQIGWHLHISTRYYKTAPLRETMVTALGASFLTR